jgi:Tol biopolymer transport system component
MAVGEEECVMRGRRSARMIRGKRRATAEIGGIVLLALAALAGAASGTPSGTAFAAAPARAEVSSGSALGTIFYIDDVTGDGGNTLAQLFRVNPDGSGRVALTGPSREVSLAAPSPDGRRIAFGFGYITYLANSDGSGRRRLPHRVHAWSPDSRSYAFAGGRPYGVHVVDPAGRVRRLTRGIYDAVYGWSADGRRIAFLRRSDLVIVDADGGRWRVTRMPDGAGALSPDWTTLIVQNEDAELFLRDLRSGVTRKLRLPDGYGARWSPDGHTFAYVGATDAGRCRLYLVNADGTGLRAVPNARFCVGSLTWSPDGTRLAFGRPTKDAHKLSENAPKQEIWTMRTDGGELRRIVPRGSQSSIVWTR